jgi:two-component system sensor histidine kinase KdpD
LALKEVAHQVERKVIHEVSAVKLSPQRFLACVSSNAPRAKMIIRKTARLASYYDAKWFVLYVQSESEAGDKIDLSVQRHLINNLKLATELGAEVVKIKHNDVGYTIMSFAEQQQIQRYAWANQLLKVLEVKISLLFYPITKKIIFESD